MNSFNDFVLTKLASVEEQQRLLNTHRNLLEYKYVYDVSNNRIGYVNPLIDSAVIIFPNESKTLILQSASTNFIPFCKISEKFDNELLLDELAEKFNLDPYTVKYDFLMSDELSDASKDKLISFLSKKYNVPESELKQFFQEKEETEMEDIDEEGVQKEDEDELSGMEIIDLPSKKDFISVQELVLLISNVKLEEFLLDLLTIVNKTFAKTDTQAFINSIKSFFNTILRENLNTENGYIKVLNALLYPQKRNELSVLIKQSLDQSIKEVLKVINVNVPNELVDSIFAYLSDGLNKYLNIRKRDKNILSLFLHNFILGNFELSLNMIQDKQGKLTYKDFKKRRSKIEYFLKNQLLRRYLSDVVRNAQDFSSGLKQYISVLEQNLSSETYDYVRKQFPTFPFEEWKETFIGLLKEEFSRFESGGIANIGKSKEYVMSLLIDNIQAVIEDLTTNLFSVPYEFVDSKVKEMSSTEKISLFKKLENELFNKYFRSKEFIKRFIDDIINTFSKEDEKEASFATYLHDNSDIIATKIYDIILKVHEELLSKTDIKEVVAYIMSLLANLSSLGLDSSDYKERILSIIRQSQLNIEQYDIIDIDGDPYFVLDNKRNNFLLANMNDLNEMGYSEIFKCQSSIDFKYLGKADFTVKQCPVDGLITKQALRCLDCSYGIMTNNCVTCIYKKVSSIEKENKIVNNIKIIKSTYLDNLLNAVNFKGPKVATVKEPITLYDEVVKRGTNYVGTVLERNIDDSLVVLFKDANKSCIMWNIELEKVGCELDSDKKSTDSDDLDFDPKALSKGTKVEMEHTDNPQIAKEIAKDHLREHPKYYEALEKMEAELEDEE